MAARWAYWAADDAPGPVNMALDDALRRYAAATGRVVLRVYGWTAPTISFGRHEAVVGRVSPAAIARAGLAAVRRPTGGRALLHRRSVTYAVAGPTLGEESLRARYVAVNAVLVAALRALGAPARLAATQRHRPHAGAACFADAAPGELVLGDAKLVGSAQRVADGGWLQHGEILLHDDQPLLGPLLGNAPAPRPAATLTEALGFTPTRSQVGAAIADAAAAEPFSESAAVAALADPAPFADPAWTWRR
jgi:lipoate-protein ligase A